jgi:hypothetical protein
MKKTLIRLVTIPKMTPEEKLAFLHDKLQDMIDEKEQDLKEAAEILRSDLGAMNVRLDNKPRRANLTDIKTGNVYSTLTKRDTLVMVLDLIDGLMAESSDGS